MRRIDAVSNLFTRSVVETRPDWSSTHMRQRFSVDRSRIDGVPIERQLELMDQAGIDLVILVVQQMGAPGTTGHWSMDAQPVISAVEQHPDRFAAQAGIDPTSGPKGIDRLRRLAREHGFVGAHFYPHWFDMPPDDPVAFPFYAACAELDIPIQIQVGQSMVYSAERPLRSVGLPMTLEPIAQAFPELSIVGSHLGYPWIDEMIALTTVYPNIYLCTDSYAPEHWPESLNRFAAGPGAGKVMFGTMWPTIDYQRAIDDITAKGLPTPALRQLMEGTVRAVYHLD